MRTSIICAWAWLVPLATVRAMARVVRHRSRFIGCKGRVRGGCGKGGYAQGVELGVGGGHD